MSQENSNLNAATQTPDEGSRDQAEALQIAVDPEHAGFRIAVVVVFLLTGVVAYLLINILIPTAGFVNILGFGGALVAATVMAQVVDGLFKRRWPSGRVLSVDHKRARLMLNNRVQREIDVTQHVNVLLWYFEITRRTRVPKGWYVVALALQQEEDYLPVYAFMPRETFEPLPLNQHFTRLQAQPDAKDLRLAGKQRRLRAAENARWMEGAEVTQEDFARYLQYLSQHFPGWMLND